MTTLDYEPRRPQPIADLYDQAESRKAEGRYAEAETLYKLVLNALAAHDSDAAPLASPTTGRLPLTRNVDAPEPTAQASRCVDKSVSDLEDWRAPSTQAKGYATDVPEAVDRSKRRIGLIKLRILAALGDLYRLQGRYREAEQLLRAVVSACEQWAGTDAPETAAVLIGLGVVCKYQGRYAEAEAHYLRAWRILTAPRRQCPPPSSSPSTTNPSSQRTHDATQHSVDAGPEKTKDDRPELWSLLYNLGGIAHAQEQYAKGEQFARRALRLAKQLHGCEHPDVAVAMSNLAANLEGLGRDDEAGSLYRRSVEIVQNNYGPWHRDVAMNLNNLAALVQRSGDLCQAEDLFLRALDIKQRALGPEHADVAVTMNNLAYLYGLQGNHGEAEALLRQSLEIFEATFAPDHPKLRAIRQNIDKLQLVKTRDDSSVKSEATVVSAAS